MQMTCPKSLRNSVGTAGIQPVTSLVQHPTYCAATSHSFSMTTHVVFDGCRPNCLQIILRGLNQVSYYYICADNQDLALVGISGFSCTFAQASKF